MRDAHRAKGSLISTKGTRDVKHTTLTLQREKRITCFHIKAGSRCSLKPDDLCTICVAKTPPDPPQILMSSLFSIHRSHLCGKCHKHFFEFTLSITDIHKKKWNFLGYYSRFSFTFKKQNSKYLSCWISILL